MVEVNGLNIAATVSCLVVRELDNHDDTIIKLSTFCQPSNREKQPATSDLTANMENIDRSHHPFTVIVAGAGIGGLSSAIALARRGLKVTVLEGKPELNEFGASISIDPHAVRILKSFGLETLFCRCIAQDEFNEIRDGASNKLLGRLMANHANTSDILFGEQKWSIHRADYQQVLAEAAQQLGTKILFNAEVVNVDIDVRTVHLSDGRALSADLIVGADGLRSAVRASIREIAGIDLVPWNEQAYRCSVDKNKIKDNPNLAWLLDNNTAQVWSMPGKYVLGWPLPPNKSYDVVACVLRDCDVPLGHWGVKADPNSFRGDFEDACLEVRELLASIGPCVQWRLAELPPLSTCRSVDGSVVLLGDAWHAMLPHSGSGGSSAIEDGAVLGECVAWASESNRPLSDATKAYEHLRKTRVERMQRASHEGVGFLSASGDFRTLRDGLLAQQMEADNVEFAKSEEVRRAQPLPAADMNAPFPSPPYLQWLYGYDGIGEARKYLAGL